MNRIELYKIAGAIMVAALLVQAVRVVGNALVEPEAEEAPPVAAVGEPTAEVAEAEKPAEPAPPPEAVAEVAEAEAPSPPEPEAETAAEAPTGPAPAEEVAARTTGIAALLAAADPKAAKPILKKCGPCHSFDKGAPNKIGPTLWGVVGAEKASRPGYKYSDGFAAKGGVWTFEELDAFLADPKAFVPGTKMIFPGIEKPEDRANVIAYLRTLSDEPPPLP